MARWVVTGIAFSWNIPHCALEVLDLEMMTFYSGWGRFARGTVDRDEGLMICIGVKWNA